jgi:hypothetical protein
MVTPASGVSVFPLYIPTEVCILLKQESMFWRNKVRDFLQMFLLSIQHHHKYLSIQLLMLLH